MILVAGATGRLGTEIVRRLREQGEDVRGLVRATSAHEKIARLKELARRPGHLARHTNSRWRQ
ncbi:MAG TPA: NmrA family NAD(P)-binding protein, partial [Gemmatimonadaceae bacterium]